MTMKEALADKEYRKRGGKFKFPSPLDTFIRGLHKRTSDLHDDWKLRLQKETAGEEARKEAVAEMLLRLRWDDTDSRARSKLSKIVARIWDALEGLDVAVMPPISSALWLEDDSEPLLMCQVAGASSQLTQASCTEKDVSEATPSDVGRQMAGSLAHSKGKGKGKGKADTEPEAAPAALRLANRGKGQGKGHKGGFRAVVVGAEMAEAAMDDGLKATLASLPPDLRQRMETFASEATSGSRVKMPWTLKAKQRKALHLWAEMHGLEHQSFGYRGKRRLHLIVPGACNGDTAEEDWEGED